jgi:hypothetical protein
MAGKAPSSLISELHFPQRRGDGSETICGPVSSDTFASNDAMAATSV